MLAQCEELLHCFIDSGTERSKLTLDRMHLIPLGYLLATQLYFVWKPETQRWFSPACLTVFLSINLFSMCLYLLSKLTYVYAGPVISLHVPVIGVHWHCHHLQHHPTCRDRPAADAHSEILLLGHQPAGVQWNHPQRPWYVHMNTHGTLTLRNKCISRVSVGSMTFFLVDYIKQFLKNLLLMLKKSV